MVLSVSERRREVNLSDLDVCYVTTKISTCDRKRFIIAEVLVDSHELMIPQRCIRPSIARPNGHLNPRCSKKTYHRPN